MNNSPRSGASSDFCYEATAERTRDDLAARLARRIDFAAPLKLAR
ncbi:MAG: hypothetical protein ABR878_01315 [Roseiarcus sp.]